MRRLGTRELVVVILLVFVLFAVVGGVDWHYTGPSGGLLLVLLLVFLFT